MFKYSTHINISVHGFCGHVSFLMMETLISMSETTFIIGSYEVQRERVPIKDIEIITLIQRCCDKFQVMRVYECHGDDVKIHIKLSIKNLSSDMISDIVNLIKTRFHVDCCVETNHPLQAVQTSCSEGSMVNDCAFD